MIIVSKTLGVSAIAALLLAAILALASSRRAVTPILEYIQRTWQVLTRSNRDLATAAVDPKFHPLPDGQWPVYVPSRDSLAQVTGQLRHEMQPADFAKIELRVLPEDSAHLSIPGLLYLPHPYVVPGGRFNEMYGWDSFFIQMGLIRDRDFTLAKDMADNFRTKSSTMGRY